MMHLLPSRAVPEQFIKVSHNWESWTYEAGTLFIPLEPIVTVILWKYTIFKCRCLKNCVFWCLCQIFLAGSHLWMMPANLTFTAPPAHSAGGGGWVCRAAASSGRSITDDMPLFFSVVKRTEVHPWCKGRCFWLLARALWPWLCYKGAGQQWNGGKRTFVYLKSH